MKDLKELVEEMQNIIDDIFVILLNKPNYLERWKCKDSESFDILDIQSDLGETICICFKCGGQIDF